MTGAVIGLGIEALACLLLGVIAHDHTSRGVLLIVAALASIPIAYFFGPISSFAAITALVLFLAGTGVDRPELGGWLGWTIAALVSVGQLALVLLVAAGALRDRSLQPIIPADRPTWQPVIAALALQVVYGVAFTVGRAAARRYRELVEDLPGTIDLWFEHYRTAIERHDRTIIALLALGLALLVVTVRGAAPIALCMISLLIIVPTIALRRRLLRMRPGIVYAWPGIVIAGCSAGFAYGIGLHSGVVAPIALLLLAGRLFRSPEDVVRAQQQFGLLASTCAGFAIVFVAVAVGVLGDDGMYRIIPVDQSVFEPLVAHVVIQAILIVAYAIGRYVDRRFAEGIEAARLAEATTTIK